MKITIFSKFNKKIEFEWQSLEKKASATPFQSFLWIKNWYDNVGKPIFNIKLQIVLIKEPDGRSIILPLGIRKVNFVKLLEALGGINSDYFFPLFDPSIKLNKDNFHKLWKNIEYKIDKFDILFISNQLKSINKKINFFTSCFYSINSGISIKQLSENLFKIIVLEEVVGGIHMKEK